MQTQDQSVQQLQQLILEQVPYCTDMDLLDLIYKLLATAECCDDVLDAGVVRGRQVG